MGRMRDGEYMYSNLSLKHAKKFIFITVRCHEYTLSMHLLGLNSYASWRLRYIPSHFSKVNIEVP